MGAWRNTRVSAARGSRCTSGPLSVPSKVAAFVDRYRGSHLIRKLPVFHGEIYAIVNPAASPGGSGQKRWSGMSNDNATAFDRRQPPKLQSKRVAD
jgi:hypothetical protein